MKIPALLSLLATAVCFSLAPSQTKAADAKIAVVDVNEVMNRYFKTKDLEERINEEGARFKMSLDKLSNERQDISKKLRKLNQEAQNQNTSENARRKIQKEITEHQKRLLKLDNDYKFRLQQGNQQLRRRQQDARNGLIGEVIKSIKTKARQDNYEVVLDKSAVTPGGAPIIPVASDAINITESVIKDLNSSQKK